MRRFILALAASAAAATAVTNPVVIRYPRYIAGRASPTDSFVGTPFVLLAGARTDTASSVYGYKPRLLVAAGAQQRFWCDTTAAPSYRNKWQTDLAAWDSCPRLTGGAPAETMKVWVVAKSVDTLPRREGLRFRVHRLPSSGQPNLDSPTPDSVTTLDMTPTGNGAWVAGHVYESNGGPLLSNHVVLAFAGDSIVGSYVTEDNGVVEGYPAEPGYFMMAVRAGNIDSVSVYARTGFTTPSPHYTQVTPPWNVPAGDTFWVDLPPSGPAIEGVTRAPDYPLSTEDVFVRARIYKAGAGVDSARILYTTDTLSGWTRATEDSIRLTDSTYVFHVPPQPDGSTVLYRLTAWSEGNNTTTALAYYFLPLDLSIYELQYCDTAVTRTSPYHGRYVHTAGTVNGVLTTTKFFIADSSGPWHSLCVYRSGGGADVHLGESLDVVGTMTEYRGLSEIGTIVRLDVNGSGRPFDTSKVTFDQARQEACECLCARVDSITVLDSTGLFNSGKTYRVRDFAGTDTLPLYVTAGCAFVGTPIPSGTFNLVANVGEYNTAELEPRYSEDIIPIVDVAAEAILAPAGTLRAGDTVSPVAVVTNLSTSTPARSFEFRFRIGTFYDVARTIALLGPGDSDTIVFNTWTATPGAHDLLAIAVFPGDPDHANDTARARVFVDDTAGSSGVWREERPLPAGARAVKDGGWLASDGQIVYAARGNKTGDFYSYRVADSAWTALTAIPNGSEGRPPYKGAVGVCDDQSNVYATKGNSTRGFWRYGTDSNWTQLPDVPLGSSRKAVKGGTDLVYVVENETGYVYLLKGYKQDFFRFNTVSGVWDTHLPPAPAGARPKWDRGSWVAFNPQPEPPADPSIYAHKAKYHELWAFSVTTHTWGTAALPGMPLVGRMGKSKKSKDGGCGAYYSGALYALKGGNTQEFWQYTIAGGAWTELDTMPSFGSTGKKKRVKAGGDIVSFGGGVFFALKGNKTLEFWRYASDALPASTGAPYRGGASARPAARSGPAAPAGTVSAGRLRLQLSGSGPVTVRLFDVTGRTALSRTLVTRNSSLDIDVSGLSAGVYLARVEEPGRAAACKLVIR